MLKESQNITIDPDKETEQDEIEVLVPENGTENGFIVHNMKPLKKHRIDLE